MNEAEFIEISDFMNLLADRSKVITLEGFNSNLTLQVKDDGSPVTDYDINSEKTLRETISAKFPNHNIFAEEIGFTSNNSGGTTGGISTGQDIFASIALKPTSSIMSSGNTINKSGKSVKVQTKGRHDPCVGLRATPIAEAMVAITLMDHFLRNRAQNADVKSKLKPIKSRK